MLSWEEYLTETVTTFRKEFQKFSPDKQKQIRKRAFDGLPLEPCQIEVLDFGVGKGVIWLLVHDNRFPDMMFKVHKDVKSIDESEFINIYKYKSFLLLHENYESILLPESMHFFTKGSVKIHIGSLSPQQVAESFLSDAKEALKTEQVDVIERSTNGLKKSIAKIPEKDVRDELLDTTKRIDGALQEIRRIDEEIGKVRQLVGVSQEYQDWKLLVSDVHRLKGEHVPREVFNTHIKRLDEKIDTGIKALDERIEDLRAIRFWSKRTLLEIALGIWGTIVTLYVAGILKF